MSAEKKFRVGQKVEFSVGRGRKTGKIVAVDNDRLTIVAPDSTGEEIEYNRLAQKVEPVAR
jgi:ribosome maturation factor RimP